MLNLNTFKLGNDRGSELTNDNYLVLVLEDTPIKIATSRRRRRRKQQQ